MDVYRNKDGVQVALGEVLSRGGEGFIHDVPAMPYSVAKVWRKPGARQARKLDVLLSRPPNLRVDSMARFELAWPTDVLYDDAGATRGYVMPKVPLDDYDELVSYCIPAARRMLEEKRGSLISKLELLTIARNLCEAFGAVHEAGYVIGDVNHTNILVRQDGKLFIIDIDSIQAKDPQTGETHRCTVGKEDFTPPRLIGQRFEDVDRTDQDDLFGLAVLIFQLLMNGSHPYDPVDQAGGQGLVRRENVSKSHSPYINLDSNQARAILGLEYIPDPALREQQRKNILSLIGMTATADFDTVIGPRISLWLELEPQLQDLFKRAFGNVVASRPTTSEWSQAINKTIRTSLPAPVPASVLPTFGNAATARAAGTGRSAAARTEVAAQRPMPVPTGGTSTLPTQPIVTPRGPQAAGASQATATVPSSPPVSPTSPAGTSTSVGQTPSPQSTLPVSRISLVFSAVAGSIALLVILALGALNETQSRLLIALILGAVIVGSAIVLRRNSGGSGRSFALRVLTVVVSIALLVILALEVEYQTESRILSVLIEGAVIVGSAIVLSRNSGGSGRSLALRVLAAIVLSAVSVFLVDYLARWFWLCC